MLQTRRINTYYYMAVSPSIPPEQMAEAGPKVEAGLKVALPVFADRWDNEWLPEVRGCHDRWDAFDLPGASDSGLQAHLMWTLETFTRS